MGLLLSVNHLFNFVAPALVLALTLPVLGRWLAGDAARSQGYWRQVLLHAVLGTLVLAGGIWLGGRDGMVVTYAALVLAAATLQWALGLRRSV